tara:strand:- start:206 stop:574 length:369 start_codon:yes stop_codon:yes gene_type:complete
MSQEYYWYLDVNAEVNKRIVDELMFEKNIDYNWDDVLHTYWKESTSEEFLFMSCYKTQEINDETQFVSFIGEFESVDIHSSGELERFLIHFKEFQTYFGCKWHGEIFSDKSPYKKYHFDSNE